jgi:hypothetical protein
VYVVRCQWLVYAAHSNSECNVPPYWAVPAGTPMTMATIKNVDPNQRTITLQVDGRMLQDLQAGDSTQVTIRKQADAK